MERPIRPCVRRRPLTDVLPTTEVLRDLRRRLVVDSLELDDGARQAHRLLRMVLRCGTLRETWVDGKCIPIGGADPAFVGKMHQVVDS